MPPKGASKHQKDWSWVNDISSPDEITLELRRRAAGLGPNPGQKACPIRRGKKDGKKTPGHKSNGLLCAPTRNGNGKRAISVNSTGTDASIKFIDEEGVADSTTVFNCTAKRCYGNPRCFNHLGMDKWWKDDARETYANDKLGEELSERDGPAGLKNYGATCYANAFLQVWFNNVTFRNGVYDAVTERVNPMYHLANIFAMMQESHRPVVDPGALIEALRLNKGSQQDAAEFSKLFMEHIEQQFKAQGGPRANFVKEQFAGQLEYRTECNSCGYVSSTNSSFFEIEVPLQDKCSLEGQLKSLLSPELLTGDNKYNCPRCLSLQAATRSTHLKQLPPVLHFALNRFEYSQKSYERQKSKAQISYPRELRLGGTVYDLRGVVVHQGTKATHGHFTCEVFNEVQVHEEGSSTDSSEQEWYFCSDGEVCKLSERQSRPNSSKKLKLGPDVVDEQVSKDAYMLVYQLRSQSNPATRPLPVHLKDAIEADNTAVHTEIAERTHKLITYEGQFDELVTEKEKMLAMIHGDDCVVPQRCLTDWFATDWIADTSSWLVPRDMKCHHGQIDPFADGGLRVISRAAFDELKKYYNDGQPRNDEPPTSSVAGSQSQRDGSSQPSRPKSERATSDAVEAPAARERSTVKRWESSHSTPQPAETGSSSKPSLSDEDAGSSKRSTPSQNGLSTRASRPTANGKRSSNSASPATEPTQNGSADHDDIEYVSFQKAHMPELDICYQCVRDEYDRLMGEKQHFEHVNDFDRANGFGGPYVLPKLWITAWRKGNIEGSLPPHKTDFSVFCEHERPFKAEKKWEGVSEEGVMVLRSLVGEFPVYKDDEPQCKQCSDGREDDKKLREQWVNRKKVEEKLSSRSRNQTHVFQTTNYLLPRSFVEKWEQYLKQPGERPTLELELCPHGLLDFDPAMDKADYFTEDGWRQLCKLYQFSAEDGVSVVFNAQPAKGKRIAVSNASKDTLFDWEEMWLPITIGETSVPSDNDGSKRRTIPRSVKDKEAQIKVTKDMTVKELRWELYEMFKVSPMSQRLLFRGRELDASETVGSMGVLMGDHLNLIEVVEVDCDADIVMAGDEGFGGTALAGQKSCPQCTLLNDPRAVECAVCGLPFE